MPASTTDHHETIASKPRNAGFRAETPESVRWRAAADAFDGLPQGVAHPQHLIDTLRKARPALRLSDSELALLTDLFAATQPKDWEQGRRPMAWPSNHSLAARLSRSISAVQRLIARLVARGLIVVRESPTGKRYGHRAADGHITLAYGFDLSLLAVRHAELKAHAAAAAQALEQLHATRARLTIARRRLLSLIEAAEHAGVWTSFWESAELQIKAEAPFSAKGRDLERLAAAAAAMEALAAEAEQVFHRAIARPTPSGSEFNDEADETRPAHPNVATLNNNTDSPIQNHCNQAQQGCKPRLPSSVPPEFATPAGGAGESKTNAGMRQIEHIEPGPLVEAARELGQAIDSPAPTWEDIAAAAADLRPRYEISHRLWQEAETSIGRRTALAIFAVMLAHGREHYRSPGGCFRRMVERHERGDLNLLASYYGLLERARTGATASTRPRDGGPATSAMSLVAIIRGMGQGR